MRGFEYRNKYNQLLTPDIVALISQIHEFKGKQTLYIEAKPDALAMLLEIAKIQSTEASNRIEGIVTTNERLKRLVREKTMPKTRSEKEIAGYRDVLSTIHESYDFIPIRPSFILQLHRDLYRYSGKTFGGSYKSSDNFIAEEHPDGTQTVRFQPVHAWETSEAMESLCEAYDRAIADGEVDPLILIPMFILDFLCIHPFNDGNGRMSRLLTLLLLYRSGYLVGQYISIEKAIADTKEAYYDALQRADQGWHEGTNDPKPFIKYMLSIILSCYKEFEARVSIAYASGAKSTSYDVVKAYVSERIGKFSKQEVLMGCPSLGSSSVESALKKLVEDGTLVRIGAGRKTMYARADSTIS